MNPTHTHTAPPAFSPAYDTTIFRRYSARAPEGKIENKLALQRELGWPEEKRTPLLCLPAGMTEELGGDMLEQVIEGIFSMPCTLLVRGVGSEKYGRLFTKLQRAYSHRMKILKNTDLTHRKMYAASDMSLFFVPEEGEMKKCLLYGVVPISPEHDLLQDYDPVQEAGNSFLASPGTPWTWYAAFIRAIETYKLPYDWRTIQKHAMETIREEE